MSCQTHHSDVNLKLQAIKIHNLHPTLTVTKTEIQATDHNKTTSYPAAIAHKHSITTTTKIEENIFFFNYVVELHRCLEQSVKLTGTGLMCIQIKQYNLNNRLYYISSFLKKQTQRNQTNYMPKINFNIFLHIS